jgi:hypothetical protein
MVAAFASDAIVIWSPNFRFSLYFSLLNAETGSHQTASSATQSGLCELVGAAGPAFEPQPASPLAGAGLPGLTS